MGNNISVDNNSPIKMINICEAIGYAGGRALLVGGYVRDGFLGIQGGDYDIEVFGLGLDEVIKALEPIGKLNLVGKSFGVIKMGTSIDISLPRSDRSIGSGHKDFVASIDPNMPYFRACLRRDLTINAIMLDPLTGEYIDPLNGRDHIRDKLIVHADEKAFSEDPLRVMRVAQFASRFEFDIDEITTQLCADAVKSLTTISHERVFMELEKILVKSENPSIAFRWLNRIGALEILFPEIYNLIGVEQGKKHHPEGDVFEHTMHTIDMAAYGDPGLDVMLAALLHDAGKYVSVGIVDPKDSEHIMFRGHAEASEIIARKFLRRLNCSNKLVDSVLPLVKYHMVPYQFKSDLKKKTVRRLASKVNFINLMHLHLSDKLGRGKGYPEDWDGVYWHKARNMYHEIKNEIKPIILGRHLIASGYTPGEHFGGILKHLYNLQLDGKFNTVEDGINELIKGGYICRQD
jgi:tRNA nucleotidyltransferase (CCA-adding enzyme)